MYDSKGYSERDELRWRFTRFMEATVQNARKNYVKRLERMKPMLSLDDVPEQALTWEDAMPRTRPDEFEFEEERLARAFRELPLMRRRILTMLFLEDLTPFEIADKMQCSVQHVYNQRSLALKKLRQLLLREGDDR